VRTFIIFLILIFFNFSIKAFPGDQDPLSCVLAFTDKPNDIPAGQIARQDLFDKGLAKGKYAYGSPYQTTNHPSLSEEEYKAKMKEEAEAQFRTAIRKFHDRSVSITKLGDSLSDLVDVYGVIKPEYWGLHPAFGAIGRNPFYMDSWDDYFSLGIYYPTEFFKVSNYSRVGDATIHTLSLLGVYKNSRESQDVLPSSNFCVQKRGIEINFGVNQTDPTNDPHSALRSSLNIQ
jgi:hypothetical protein